MSSMRQYDNQDMLYCSSVVHVPTTVGSKGQVVIEKHIRDRLGVKPGAIAVQALVGDRVEIRFVAPAHSRSLFGALAQHVKQDIADREWAKVKRQAWERSAKDQEATPAGSEPIPPGGKRSARPRKRRRA